MPLHKDSPEGPGWHVPPTQDRPLWHGLLQPPQCLASVLVLAQPEPHRVNPTGQETVHLAARQAVPAEQAGLPWVPVVDPHLHKPPLQLSPEPQVMPHQPQLDVSMPVLAHLLAAGQQLSNPEQTGFWACALVVPQ